MNDLKKLENLHIGIWLVKDCAWSQTWVCVGMMAALPALYLQIYITWKSRKISIEEMVHNAAVCFWIAANVIWMMGEFFWNVEDKWLNQWLFFAGLALIIGFNLYKHRKSFYAILPKNKI